MYIQVHLVGYQLRRVPAVDFGQQLRFQMTTRIPTKQKDSFTLANAAKTKRFMSLLLSSTWTTAISLRDPVESNSNEITACWTYRPGQ